MKKMILCCLAAACLLAGCAMSGSPAPGAADPEETLLREDFLLGMDTSCVPALEESGVHYRDQEGTEKDVFQILQENGIGCIRVRVWNDPFDAQGRGYGGGNCDIQNALAIGQRATAQGMNIMVDFHYSDFWADPGKQQAPKAWAGMQPEEKAEALYQFTRDSLQLLKDQDVEIGMVQVGNETNGFFCGESDWEVIARLMNAGARAVREICPDALVVLHFSNPEKAGSYEFYGKQLEELRVDYDVFASSYYPYWHGSLENLASQLSHISETYDKLVMVAETSYAFTLEDTDFHGNTIGENAAPAGYPFTPQGQMDFLADLAQTLKSVPGCIGLCYWEGTWISAGGSSWQENKALWETHGSGWASSYAGEYDPIDAGAWHGGCAVDNQAFFDEHGNATQALQIFAQLGK